MPAWVENDKSAQPCGCDEGAKHQCQWHQTENTGIPISPQPAPYNDKSKPKKALGLGGAPTRATTLPDDPAERKKYPIASGFLDYFPDAVAAVAYVSWVGNEQHNPGLPLHWDRSKSKDESDTMQRHFLQRGTSDKDGTRHLAKAAWRCMAMLQKEIEAER